MKTKLFLLTYLLFSLIYGHAFAEDKEAKAEKMETTPRQTPWVRRGDVPRQPEDGEYTVKEGDTLWDISKSFLQDPFKWQNLWDKNRHIIDPHLIYPGNKIILFPHEPVEAGEKAKEAGVETMPVVPEGLPVEKLQKPEVAAKEAVIEAQMPPPPPVTEEKPLPPALPVPTISSLMMERHGFISDKDREGVGVIIGSKEERLLLSQGDIVYLSFVKGTEVKQSDMFTVFKINSEVKHPVTKEPMGFLTDTLGAVEVIKVEADGVIAARIEKSYKEILKGSKLRPYEPFVKEIPVKKAEKAADGFIIAAIEGKVGIAEKDIVYIDKGKNSGLEQGIVMNISRPTTTVRDPMYKEEEEKTITFLPAELGKLIIISADENTSSAFIINSRDVIYKGDRVRTAK